MTFSASSIEAWCLTSGCCSVAASVVGSDTLRLGLRTVSRFQFARPAVEFSVFDQTSFTPPVLAERDEILPSVIVSSRSRRKESAILCLVSSKALRASISAFVRFVGLSSNLLGEEGGETEDDDGSARKRAFLGERRGFCGEYVSCHSLMFFASQKASMLGRPGGVGRRNFFFDGETSFTFDGDAGGGVEGRSSGSGVWSRSFDLEGRLQSCQSRT